MNHRIGRAVFATLVGLAVAIWSYQWITNPAGREERAQQEQTVLAARHALGEITGLDGLQIVDPLAPARKVGKVYVFRLERGWEVSGYYRRGDNDSWHPYLMQLDAERMPLRVSVNDPGLRARAAADARLEVSR